MTALPRWRGLRARFGDAIPEFGLLALPLVITQGRRTQRKLLARGGPVPRR